MACPVLLLLFRCSARKESLFFHHTGSKEHVTLVVAVGPVLWYHGTRSVTLGTKSYCGVRQDYWAYLLTLYVLYELEIVSLKMPDNPIINYH